MLQRISAHTVRVLLAAAALSLAAGRTQAFEDCNNDGIPDNILGLGRLFRDTFLQPTLNQDKWALVSDATVDDVGINEPSEPYSLRLNGLSCGGDSIESVTVDLSVATDAVLTYSWQHTGGGESPDDGDDLFVEFADATGTWVTLAQHLGSGSAMTTYQEESITLPPEAYHENFVLRLRCTAATGNFDDWFVDNIFITDGVPDCNNNGVPDDCDIADGTSEDCNDNGIPDECDVAEVISADCNGNGIPDECDILDGTSIDSNGDFVPDECQDCNNNGVLDPLDIADGTSEDCNRNGIPDECDLAGGGADCNGNGVLDECDMSSSAYQLDDGSQETWVGASAGGGFIWLNQFAVEPGDEEIAGVSLTWGNVAVGTPTTIAIWSDPDNDGDPTNAVLLLTSDPVPVANPKTNVFTMVPLTPTYVGEVGDVFFVGAYVSHLVGENPASLDRHSPNHERSWLAIGDNLADLSANSVPPALIDSFGVPGDWLIRGHSSDRDCNRNRVLDACDIAAGTSNDFDVNGIPDECEAAFNAVLALTPDTACYPPGTGITVTIDMLEVGQEILGGQFFLRYDTNKLDFVSIEPGDASGTDPNNPFEQEIYEDVNEAAGLIDYAVGVLNGEPGTFSDTTMAIVTFTALAEVCEAPALLEFRPHDPPTRLTGRLGAEVFTQTIDLSTISIDDMPPELTVPPDMTVPADIGPCAASLDPGHATATDNCTPSENIIISWVRSDGKTSLIDPYDVADSPITITWTAEDQCGNSSSDVTTITVLLWGDLDYDHDVDLADLAMLLTNYGNATGMGYEDGDLDGDGDVDLADLAALLTVYGTVCE